LDPRRHDGRTGLGPVGNNDAFLLRELLGEQLRRTRGLGARHTKHFTAAFAAQKDRMDLFIRTIGTARATTKIGMANLVYNIKRLFYLRRTAAA
jgi:hypothetical protein